MTAGTGVTVQSGGGGGTSGGAANIVNPLQRTFGGALCFALRHPPAPLTPGHPTSTHKQCGLALYDVVLRR